MFPSQNLLAYIALALAATTLVSAEAHDTARRNHGEINRMIRKRAPQGLGVIGLGAPPPTTTSGAAAATVAPVNAGADPKSLSDSAANTASTTGTSTTATSTTGTSTTGTASTTGTSTTGTSTTSTSATDSSASVSASAASLSASGSGASLSASGSSTGSGSSTVSGSSTASLSTTSSESTVSTTSSTSTSTTSTSATPATTPPPANNNNGGSNGNGNSKSGGTVTKSVVIINQTQTVGGGSQQSTAAPEATAAVAHRTTISLAVIGAIAGSIGGVALLWTIIRKWKFRPSRDFEDRMQPINWQPDDGADDGLPNHRRSVASSFHSAGHDTSLARAPSYGATASYPAHDFTSGATTLAPGAGYADLARGASPAPYDMSRGPSPPMAQYDHSLPIHHQNAAYGGEYDLGNGTTGPRY